MICRMGAAELHKRITSGDLTPDQVAEAHRARIAEAEPIVKALLTVLDPPDKAGERGSGRAAAEPKGRLLEGIPVVVKDNICTAGVRTTCGSRILREFVPPYDATVIAKLRSAGALILAKSNLDEFAMGSSTENSAFGPSRNPWDPSRVPGGSSGGSAAAVAAFEAPLALGSDTGGSIRQPAALCGVVGMKPTYGRVSRYGLVAYASSLDQIGPIARTVRDAALLLDVICGADPMDSTTLPLPPTSFVNACRADVKGLRIGLPREYFGHGVEATVAAAVRQAADRLCGLGAHVEECSLPSTEFALAAYYILAPAEASSNLARYDGVKYGHRAGAGARRSGAKHAESLNVEEADGAGSDRDAGPVGHGLLTERSRGEGFGAEVKQRIMIGTYALSAGYYDAYYLRAQQVRTLIRREFERAFERYDVLLTPTSPTIAFRLGERSADPLAMKLADICTIPANLAGLPAISVPCGFDQGLPIGLQIIGKPLDEATVIRVAYTFEQGAPWSGAVPPAVREETARPGATDGETRRRAGGRTGAGEGASHD